MKLIIVWLYCILSSVYAQTQGEAQIDISLTNIGSKSSPRMLLFIEANFGSPYEVGYRKVTIEANDYENNSHADRIKIIDISDNWSNGSQEIIFYHGDEIRKNLLDYYKDLFDGIRSPDQISFNEYGIFEFNGHPKSLKFQKENSIMLKTLFKKIDQMLSYVGNDIESKFYFDALKIAKLGISNY